MTEREQERAAVVAWLRSEAQIFRKQGGQLSGYHAEAAEEYADAIERGDHIGKE